MRQAAVLRGIRLWPRVPRSNSRKQMRRGTFLHFQPLPRPARRSRNNNERAFPEACLRPTYDSPRKREFVQQEGMNAEPMRFGCDGGIQLCFILRLYAFTPLRLHAFTPSRLHAFTPSRLHAFTPDAVSGVWFPLTTSIERKER